MIRSNLRLDLSDADLVSQTQHSTHNSYMSSFKMVSETEFSRLS